MRNKEFWNTVLSYFLIIKKCPRERFILVKNQKFIIEEQKLAREFNAYYTTFIQNTSRRIPLKLEVIDPSLTDSEIVKRIMIHIYSSTNLIEQNLSQKDSFHSANVVNKIVRNKNPEKTSGPEKILIKLVKLSIDY